MFNITNLVKMLTITSCALLTVSCASIVSGNQQSLSVVTSPAAYASCTLENNKGTWYIPHTPGSVVVTKSYEDLNITCDKPGYKRAIKRVVSATRPMVFGNVLFGGPIGAGVDVASGAAYNYPSQVNVFMDRR